MRIEWTGYEEYENDAPSFEKILRKKPHREYEERVEKKIKPPKHQPREDKE